MMYEDGSMVSLGDVVGVPFSGRIEFARVIMLGDSNLHLEIDQDFLAWVEREHLIDESSVVVEWLGDNPFAHQDPRYAPVGNYMFVQAACLIRQGGIV